jgi:hypothetical protein
MTIIIGLWSIPTAMTVIVWLWAYLQDRKDPVLGQLWAFAAAGATVACWIFYALLWIVL